MNKFLEERKEAEKEMIKLYIEELETATKIMKDALSDLEQVNTMEEAEFFEDHYNSLVEELKFVKINHV